MVDETIPGTGTRDRDEIKFNKELSSARVKVECAFGLLKSRRRVLQKCFDSSIEFAVKNAIACAVLHNLYILWGDDWEEEDNDDDNPCPPNVIIKQSKLEHRTSRNVQIQNVPKGEGCPCSLTAFPKTCLMPPPKHSLW